MIVTSDMTAAKAVNMVLEGEKKGEKPKDPEAEDEKSAVANAALSGNKNKIKAEAGTERPSCKTGGRLHWGVCYTERPDSAPDWYHEMKGTKRKRGLYVRNIRSFKASCPTLLDALSILI